MLPPPFSNPVSSTVYALAWSKARQKALTEAQIASPLAKRPYDLRHAAVSLWLNAGVPATQVAEWAGHSVNVLLRVYAKCVDGQDEAARRRVGQRWQSNRQGPERRSGNHLPVRVSDEVC